MPRKLSLWTPMWLACCVLALFRAAGDGTPAIDLADVSGGAPDTWGLVSYSLLGCSAATISAAPPSPQAFGTGTVVFTGTAATCGTPHYQFWYYGPGGPWHMVQDWSPKATYDWDTSVVPPGTYAWVVYVRQHGSGSAYDSFALVSYTTS